MELTERRFEDVFPGLHVSGKLAELLPGISVQRVVTNRAHSVLRIYVKCDGFVAKEKIYALEEAIGAHLADDGLVRVRLIERFVLPADYTAEHVLSDHAESIAHEFEQQNHLLGWLYRTAGITAQGNAVDVEIEESVITRGVEKDFAEALDTILNERCRLGAEINLRHREKVSRASSEEERVETITYEEAAARQPRRESGTAVAAEMPAEGLPWEAGGPVGAGASAGAASGAESGSGTDGGEEETKERSKPIQASRPASSRAYRRAPRKNDPSILYGRYFEGDDTPIEEIDEGMADVVIRGCIIDTDSRALRNGRGLVVTTVTDETDTIRVKLFVDEEDRELLAGKLKSGTCIQVCGKVTLDSFEKELVILSVRGIRHIPDFRAVRADESEEKRVELHCHTKMSDMDGVSDVGDIIRRAYAWGHPAIALTDHGGVQAFPDANAAIKKIDAKYREQYEKDHPDCPKEELKKIVAPFKVLYGCEGYLVDDRKGIAVNVRGQKLSETYVVFDLETTGLSNEVCRIIEIGAVKVENGEITERFSTFVDPGEPIPLHITELTGISDHMLAGAPKIEEILPKFRAFCEGAVMVAHNADFDMGFIKKDCARQGLPCDDTYLDTVLLARVLFPGLANYKLDKVAKAAGVPLERHHRAVDDAACTAGIFVKMIEMLNERGIDDLDGVNALGDASVEAKRKMRANHVVLLAANETGRVNLYRLVSESHLNYFYKQQARMPKSLIEQFREGLIIGSACVKGELYEALLRGASHDELARIVSFYDYLEIQPRANNAYLIMDEKQENITCEEDILELNRRVVALGEEFGKPVVATGDVHFLDPQDEVYRRIIMAGRKFKDADGQSPLYLHTTEEMLEEFAYLGEEKAREVVISNPQKIADRIERISPIRKGKFPPVIEDSDKTLRQICYDKAHEIYGETLPQLVEARLERELDSIISNGYAVMYIIAQKLVWKSNEDGYLVGSRGSVGSSFVATMAGITEVNPLPPHYLCEKCHHVDFDSESVAKYRDDGKAGCDMPDAVCPVCGAPMAKLGFNIPFETFLGFEGNKEPDIDLNFSGEYQSKAHKYTEVIFGTGQTFRAGTIGTMKEKTAYGYVKNYYEERGQHKRSCEIDRIVRGCVGIRRTTGQHPGGIIVLPIGEDINSFTPVQHPADDMTTDIITTHFDYHSIDENLLKLDILGHDDPTMIRMLMDLTDTDATHIPLDEPQVMSLFAGTEALGITPEDIGGCALGCLGVPEFGTDFVIQMLLDTKPTCFSDLIRISGLSHGTDVWLGNAQTLIEEGKATIGSAICTRDDIMTYLISKGMESERSFKIMESVRKGKGLKEKWEKEMREHEVPEWYIWSCKKIKYMFPKAHAVAYVMMAYRIAWYKIYHPLAYYAAYFSIRASAFSYEKMCMGRERLEEHMRAFEEHRDEATNQEQEAYKDMKIVREMYARGFDFTPIDLYRADASRFSIVDGKLMPAFTAIEGLGEKAAESIAEAAKEGPFLSRDDLRRRSGAGKTILETMDRLGILGDLPESDQLSLFDLAGTAMQQEKQENTL